MRHDYPPSFTLNNATIIYKVSHIMIGAIGVTGRLAPQIFLNVTRFQRIKCMRGDVTNTIGMILVSSISQQQITIATSSTDSQPIQTVM